LIQTGFADFAGWETDGSEKRLGASVGRDMG